MVTQKGDTMDLTAARPGQRGALRTILTRITAGEQSTSIILPTGYGKSDVMRLAAIQLYDEGKWRAVLSWSKAIRCVDRSYG
jgi:superfamily II DNA helicase RecQ